MPEQYDSKVHRTRIMSIISIGLFIEFMAILSLIPMLPAVSEDLNVAKPFMGVIMGSFMVFMAIPQIPIGMLSDKYGRRPFIIIGILTFSIGLLIFGLAKSAEQLLIARSLSGLGVAMFLPTAYAIGGDIYSIRERGKGIGFISMAIGLGTVGGYILGGVVGGLFGWRTVFLSMFWASLLVAIGSLWVNETRPKSLDTDFGILKIAKSTLLMFWDRTLVLTGLVSMLCSLAVIGASFTLPFFAAGTVSSVQMGLIFVPYAITSSLGASVTGSISDSVGRKTPLITMIILGGAALLLLTFDTMSPIIISINFGFVGLCLGPVVTLSTAILSDQVVKKDPRILGTSIGVLNMVRWLGGASGPVVAGTIMEFADARTSFMTLGILVLFATFIAFFLRETLE
ncbi:MAG: MFS transporter [Methanosarcinales archaeon]|nr:MFS transporter [Methanosarcinales archaeon]